MTRLIKNELNRIYTCKINRISVLLLIMISVIYGFLTVFQDQTITYYEQGIILTAMMAKHLKQCTVKS